MDKRIATVYYLDRENKYTKREFSTSTDTIKLTYSSSGLLVIRQREIDGCQITGRTFIPLHQLIDVVWSEPYLYKANVL